MGVQQGYSKFESENSKTLIFQRGGIQDTQHCQCQQSDARRAPCIHSTSVQAFQLGTSLGSFSRHREGEEPLDTDGSLPVSGLLLEMSGWSPSRPIHNQEISGNLLMNL